MSDLRSSRVLHLLALGALAAAAHAQTGPFQDGELIVRSLNPTIQKTEIYRIDPVTGHGATLWGDQYPSYSAGDWIAYDPYRDGLLAYTSTNDPAYGGWAQPRLYLIRADGGVTDLGLASQQITAIAPAKAGGVYLRKKDELYRLTPANTLLPVIDSATGQVAKLTSVDHLIYDAPTHSLIGAVTSQVTVACNPGLGKPTVQRYSLSPDGLTIVAHDCAAYTFTTAASPVGLDRLPDGDYLLTLADGFSADDNLLRVDPAGPSIALFAQCSVGDLDGGVWSDTHGGALVFDDVLNELRLYVEGSSGLGPVFSSDVLFHDASTGTSTATRMTDVDLDGPTCPGEAVQFGAGLAGSAGRTPRLGAASCPDLGLVLPLTIGNAAGSAQGVLVGGLAPTAVPVFGGTLHVAPPFVLQQPFVTSPFPGFAQISLVLPDVAFLVGLPLYMQAAVLDPAAPQGYALSNGLTIVAY